jgi:hypothetical protein
MTWVKLFFLEVWLRSGEQLDKRTSRGTSILLRGNRVPIIKDVRLTKLKRLHRVGK